MPVTREQQITWHVANYGGRPSISQHWVQGNNQESITAIVDWVDYDPWTVDMLGFSEYRQDGGPSGSGISRVLPETHPDYPWMVPVEIELMGIHGTMGENDSNYTFPDDAKVEARVTYRSVMYQLQNDIDVRDSADGELIRFVEPLQRFQVEALEYKGKQLVYSDLVTPTPIPAPIQRIYALADIYYTWHQVPCGRGGKLPQSYFANLDSCVAKVNDSPFDTGRFPAETLLCYPPEVKPTRSATGTREFTVHYHLLYRPSGWNKKWRPTDASGNPSPGFYPVVIEGLNTKLYETADFSKLFKLV